MTREILDELQEIQEALYRITRVVSMISREVEPRDRDNLPF